MAMEWLLGTLGWCVLLETGCCVPHANGCLDFRRRAFHSL